MVTRQAKLLSWAQANWQVLTALVALIALFVGMQRSIEANAKDTTELKQTQLRQSDRIEAQRREVDLLKQQFARVDERINSMNDKLDGQARTLDRIFDVVQKK